MAKKIDTSNLSVDYKQLMRMTVQDRVGLAKSGLGEELMRSLTPTQLALAFPKYYARQLPDIGRVITGGGAAPTYGGGTAPSYGGGRPSQTAAPVPSAPSGRQNPQLSSTAKENQQNEFLNEIRRQLREKEQGAQILSDITSNEQGYVNPTQFRNSMMSKIRNSGLIGFIPPDGERYGIKKGTAEEWANYFTGLAKHESGLKTTTHGDVGKFGGHGSRGLFQLSPQDAITYGIQNKPFTYEQLQDPNFNADVALKIHEHWLLKKRQGIQEGAGKYWAPISKEGWTPGTGRDRTLPWSEWSKQDATGIIPQDTSKSQKASSKEGLREGVKAQFQTPSIAERAGMMKQSTQDALGRFRILSPNDSISSTYRSPTHPIESKKRVPGAHSRGEAIDIGTRGKSSQELQSTIQNLKKAGFNFILLEGNPPHIHAELRPNQEGFRIQNLGSGHPTISLDDAKSAASQVELGSHGLPSEMPADKIDANKEIPVPSDYESWPPILRKYLENNPNIKNEVFDIHSKGINVLDAFNKAYESNPKIFEQSSEVTADLVKTITNNPPGELPNLEQYLETGKQLSSLIEPKAVDDITKLPAANRFSRTGLDPYSMQKDIVSVKTAAGPARLHKDAAAAFTSAIQDLKDEGFPVSKLGSLNIRQKRWSSSWSEHSYGNAIDIDDRLGWTKEQLKWIKDNPGKLDQILNRYGLNRPMPDNTQEEARKSGRRYDPNHIEYRGAVTPEGLARIQEKKQKYQEYLEQKGINTKTIVTSPPPDTQTQQGQAPVPAEAVAVPSPQKLEKPSGQQDQGGGVAPPRQGVPAASQAPQAPQAVPAAQAAPQAPPVATAVPVPSQEDVPSKNAYGGRETTTENVGFFDTETGKTLGTMKRGEVATVNRSGIVDLTPQQRIGEVAQLRPEFNQQPQQEQPQQQSNQPVASMTPSTQMTQTQPNMYNDTNQIYGGMIGSIYDRPASVDAAYRMARLQSNPTRENIDVGNTGYNTLA